LPPGHRPAPIFDAEGRQSARMVCSPVSRSNANPRGGRVGQGWPRKADAAAPLGAGTPATVQAAQAWGAVPRQLAVQQMLASPRRLAHVPRSQLVWQACGRRLDVHSTGRLWPRGARCTSWCPQPQPSHVGVATSSPCRLGMPQLSNLGAEIVLSVARVVARQPTAGCWLTIQEIPPTFCRPLQATFAGHCKPLLQATASQLFGKGKTRMFIC
jgi:hypothetical protein